MQREKVRGREIICEVRWGDVEAETVGEEGRGIAQHSRSNANDGRIRAEWSGQQRQSDRIDARYRSARPSDAGVEKVDEAAVGPFRPVKVKKSTCRG